MDQYEKASLKAACVQAAAILIAGVKPPPPVAIRHTSGRNADRHPIRQALGRRVNVVLGDPQGEPDSAGRVNSFTEAAEWLRDKAIEHYPDSQFAKKYTAGANIIGRLAQLPHG